VVSTSITIPAGHLNVPFAVVTPEKESQSRRVRKYERGCVRGFIKYLNAPYATFLLFKKQQYN
jgi:hypothetical protein